MWKCQDFLSLRFYVKSMWRDSRSAESAFFQYSAFKMCNNWQNQNPEALNVLKWQIWHTHNPKTWFHVRFEWLKNPENSTLCTMLQKLSKFEVKAWLCWNLIILLPLRFHVKSHFGKFKRSKNVICSNIRDAGLWILVNLGLEKCKDLPKFKVQRL